jgi:hypothetical protein
VSDKGVPEIVRKRAEAWHLVSSGMNYSQAARHLGCSASSIKALSSQYEELRKGVPSHWPDRLTLRAIRALRLVGVFDDEALRGATEDTKRQIKRLPNHGKATYIEICKFAAWDEISARESRREKEAADFLRARGWRVSST